MVAQILDEYRGVLIASVTLDQPCLRTSDGSVYRVVLSVAQVLMPPPFSATKQTSDSPVCDGLHAHGGLHARLEVGSTGSLPEVVSLFMEGTGLCDAGLRHLASAIKLSSHCYIFTISGSHHNVWVAVYLQFNCQYPMIHFWCVDTLPWHNSLQCLDHIVSTSAMSGSHCRQISLHKV
jgi:hypothetical protein